MAKKSRPLYVETTVERACMHEWMCRVCVRHGFVCVCLAIYCYILYNAMANGTRLMMVLQQCGELHDHTRRRTVRARPHVASLSLCKVPVAHAVTQYAKPSLIHELYFESEKRPL